MFVEIWASMELNHPYFQQCRRRLCGFLKQLCISVFHTSNYLKFRFLTSCGRMILVIVCNICLSCVQHWFKWLECILKAESVIWKFWSKIIWLTSFYLVAFHPDLLVIESKISSRKVWCENCWTRSSLFDGYSWRY